MFETPIMKGSYGTDQCKLSHGLVLGKRWNKINE